MELEEWSQTDYLLYRIDDGRSGKGWGIYSHSKGEVIHVEKTVRLACLRALFGGDE
jgi:hypothetical protein